MDGDMQEKIKQLPDSIVQAYERIRPFVYKTPLSPSAYLSTDAQVYFKLGTYSTAQ